MNNIKANKYQRCPYCDSIAVNSVKIYNNKRQYKCRDCSKYFTVIKEDVDKVRVVFISDLHCGHITGLTHPDYNFGNDKFYEWRKEAWEWFTAMAKRIQRVDVVILNGDAIDGRQEKSGGAELITGDRFKQCEMAIKVIEELAPKSVFMTYGTPYHVGQLEQFENSIAKTVGGQIFNKLLLDVNGCIIDVRHKIGRSNIPHGRFTALARTSMWNDLMNETETKANIITRSHVHYFTSIQHSNNRIAFTTPGLQGYTNFGEKECEGNVDFGFVKVDIDKFGMIDDFKLYKANLSTNVNPIVSYNGRHI